jgi:hypothetical protein
VEASRQKITVWVLAGALVPPALAYVGYLVAGRPHVDCDETTRTAAFYHVAMPFFVLGGIVGAVALVQVARIGRRSPERPWAAQAFAMLTVLVAFDALLPGSLHHPAGAVVAVLGIGTFFGAIVTFPVTFVLVVWAGISLVRRRSRGTPEPGERRLYTVLLGWGLAATLPALILGLSLNADPLCFSF